jgi:predicted amidohydrolase
MIKSGRLSGAALTADGKIDVAEADRQLAGDVDAAECAGKIPPLSVSKAYKAYLDAEKSAVELAALQGVYIPREPAGREIFAFFRQERDRILGLPARVAPQMAAELGVDETRLHNALLAVLREHLKDAGKLPLES